jgi:parallel beta-helix repeat protein
MFCALDFSFGIIDGVGGEVLYVNESGSNGAYSKIQDAINASSNGDTVFVYSGTYYEKVVVNKTISLVGEDRNNTIIDMDGNGDVVRITVDWVNITGFCVTGDTRPFQNGIKLNNVQNCSIIDTEASKCAYGIYLNNAHENNITNSIVSSNIIDGFHLYGSNANKITGNIVSQNIYNGINFDYFCDRNKVKSNIVSGSEYGIFVRESNDNNITDNNVSSNSDGIFVYSSFGNNIHNNNIYSNSKLGIYLELAEENDINGNNVSSNNRGGIWLEDSPGNNISRNTIFWNNYNGIYLYESDSLNITGNNVSSNDRYGIAIWSSKLNTLRNNTIIKNGIAIEGTSLFYWNTHDIDTSNTVNGKPVYYWKNLNGGTIPPGAGQVILANCTEIKIEDQELTNSSIGIELGFSSKINITGNNVSSNRYYAIFLYSSSGNNVINNNGSNSEFGIFLHGFYESSNRNEIAGNSFNSNNQYGIEIYSGRENNITSNNASYNIYCGIHLSYGSKNSIISNDISNNGIGIYVASTANNNKIFYNNLIDNLDQTYDHTINDNLWDNGYPLGGNYWSYYSGVDKFKGPNQDQMGIDGIGDIPYVIDSNSQDNYPLINPYSYKSLENYTILKKGWNLISVPLIQQNQSLKKVLEMIDGWYDAVQWYNPTDPNDPWKHHKIGKSYGNDLFELNETMGFWVHIINPGDTIFVYNGTQPPVNQTIPLHPGWNLVGYPSLTSHNRTMGLNNLEFDLEINAVWTYDSLAGSWEELGEPDNFRIGKGYWIHAKTDCDWEVPL